MNHRNPSNDDIDAVEELNRSWDAWNAQPSPPVPDRGERSDLFAEIHAIDDAPAPDAAFLAALRADLVKPTPVLSTSPIGKSSLGLVAMPIAAAHFPRMTPIRLVYAGIAAALLIAALVGGNRWLPGSGSAVMVASAMASPASRDEPTPTTYPDSSASRDGSTSLSLHETVTDLVIHPTAIPLAPENTTSGVSSLRVVRTPAIVYSVE